MTTKNDDSVEFGASTEIGNPDGAMIEPEFGGIYVIELCSGELRRWRYLGPGVGSRGQWRDVETGLEFSETTVMYAWQIVDIEDPTFQPERENSVSLTHGNGLGNKK